MIEDYEARCFRLDTDEAFRLKADRMEIPFREAPGFLAWVQYRQALNEEIDPSVYPSGADKSHVVQRQITDRDLFAGIIDILEPHVAPSIAKGAELLLRSQTDS